MSRKSPAQLDREIAKALGGTAHATKRSAPRSVWPSVIGSHDLGTADVRARDGAYWIVTVPTGYRVDYKPWGPSNEVDLGTFPSRQRARAKIAEHAIGAGASRSHATKKPAKQIVGFEFLIKDDGQSYWTRLQGSGGQRGAGSLHAIHNLDPKNPYVQAVGSKLLSQAREELRREGTIRSYRDHEDPGQRIRPVAASAVLKCRPIVG